MSDNVTGVGGQGLEAVLTVECGTCPNKVSINLSTYILTLTEDGKSIVDALNELGWFYNLEDDWWRCPAFGCSPTGPQPTDPDQLQGYNT